MSEPKKRPNGVKPKAVKVWCPVGDDGTPRVFLTRPTRAQAINSEHTLASAMFRKPRPIHQFTLTPVRRKKR